MAGRPKRKFSDEQVQYITENAPYLTIADVARYLDIPHQTATDHFRDLLRKSLVQPKIDLRKAMWEKALEGNPTMMIYMSKNYLDMSDDGIVSPDDLVGDVEFGDVEV